MLPPVNPKTRSRSTGLSTSRAITERVKPAVVRRSDEFGLPVDAKEAMLFAVLGAETLRGAPANLPSATGAARPVVLGQIVPGRGWPGRFQGRASP